MAVSILFVAPAVAQSGISLGGRFHLLEIDDDSGRPDVRFDVDGVVQCQPSTYVHVAPRSNDAGSFYVGVFAPDSFGDIVPANAGFTIIVFSGS